MCLLLRCQSATVAEARLRLMTWRLGSRNTIHASTEHAQHEVGTRSIVRKFLRRNFWARRVKMQNIMKVCSRFLAAIMLLVLGIGLASAKQPNIVVIMGDDVGMWNIGAYHRGLMAGRTPNLDKIAAEGMLFTDYYAEASCTAGRANFVTGELPIRTGMTTVGQAGAPTGLPAQAVTIA